MPPAGRGLTKASVVALARVHAAQDAKAAPPATKAATFSTTSSPVFGKTTKPAWMPTAKVGPAQKPTDAQRFATAPFKPSVMVPVKSNGGLAVATPNARVVNGQLRAPSADVARTSLPTNTSADLVKQIPGGSVLARGLSNIATGLNYSPAAAYRLGDAMLNDSKDAFLGRAPKNRTFGIVKQTAQGEARALMHPGAHPEAIPMAVFGGANALAGAAERLGAAASAGGAVETGGAGAFLKTLAKRPVGAMRTIYGPNGDTALALNSEAPISRLLQRQMDKVTGIDKPGVQRNGLLSPLQQHRFDVHQGRMDRVVNDVGNALPPQQLREKIAGAPPREVQNHGWLRNTGGQAVRIFNRASRGAILYGKLGYVPTNLLGQESLLGIEQGPGFLLNQARGMRTHGQLNDLGKARADALSGTGSQVAAATAKGANSMRFGALGHVENAVDFVDRSLGNAAAKVIDNPTRRGSIYHQLRRQGIKSPEDIQRSLALLAQHHANLDSGAVRPGSLPRGEARKALEAGLRTRQSQIDFESLGKTGQALRNAIFFTPWLKGSALYTGHFFRDHPMQAAATVNAGQWGQKHAGLGAVPSFMGGYFKVADRNVPGLGRVPLAVNPGSTAILNQAPQLGAIGAGMLGLTPNKPGIDPQSLLSPWLYAIDAGLTHTDPFTKHKIPATEGLPQIMANQFINQIPLYSDFYKGGAFRAITGHGPKAPVENARNVLFPRTVGDQAWRFALSGLAPAPVNPVAQQSRVRSETTAAESRSQAIQQRMEWFKSDLLGAMNRARKANGLPPMASLPWGKALNAIEAKQQEGLKVKGMSPHAATSHGTLSSVGELAARYRVWAAMTGKPQSEIDTVTKKILAIDPANTKLVKQLAKDAPWYGMFSKAMNQPRRYANEANSVNARKYPYANGGAPIAIPSSR